MEVDKGESSTIFLGVKRNNDDDDNDAATTTATASTLSEGQLERIVTFVPEWPVCRYHVASRRNRTKQGKTLEELLNALDGWDRYPEIALDGANGTGKSHLARNLNRVYLKINDLAKRVTTGSDYNHSPIRSLEYMMLQHCAKARSYVCWDRCRYSNLIFYYVHQLMYRFRDVAEMPFDERAIFPILNEIALATNLLETVTFLESEKRVPTLFLVNRNLVHVALSLMRRGGLNDLYNAKEYNYQAAQYLVYKYFGKLLNYPVFDLADMIDETFTLGDLQQIVRHKIDVRVAVAASSSSSSSSITTNIVETPDLRAADELAKRLDEIDDDLLVYTYSAK